MCAAFGGEEFFAVKVGVGGCQRWWWAEKQVPLRQAQGDDKEESKGKREDAYAKGETGAWIRWKTEHDAILAASATGQGGFAGGQHGVYFVCAFAIEIVDVPGHGLLRDLVMLAEVFEGVGAGGGSSFWSAK